MPTTTDGPPRDLPRLLRAYIADHLQLLRAAHALAARTRRREGDGDPELARLLDEVMDETRRQEAIAIGLLRQLGAARPWLRLAAASLAERVGRLKPNGRLRRPSPLAPLFELEVLEGLLGSCARFWRALAHADAVEPALALRQAEGCARLVPGLERRRLAMGERALGPLAAAT